MFSIRYFAALAVLFLLPCSGVFSAHAATPGDPTEIIHSFSALVDEEAAGVDYLEEEQVSRIRARAGELFPLRPKVSAGEAARIEKEGEKAFLAEEIRKTFPRSEAEVRQDAEKEAADLFPFFEKGDRAEVTYRFGKYHAKGVYYGQKGEYLLIGGTSVPVRDLKEEELRKFDPEKNKAAREAHVRTKCKEHAEKRQAALRDLQELWDHGREDRRFRLGYLRFLRKWRSGEQLLDELVRRKNRELLQAVRERSEKLVRIGDLGGADQILQRFLTAHPALASELEPDRQRLRQAAAEERSREALAAAGRIPDPDEARSFLEKFLADDPGTPCAAEIRSTMATLEIRSGELKKCREAIGSAGKLKSGDACAFLEHFISEYSDYFGIDEVKAVYQIERKKVERLRCARVLDEARRIGSDEQAVQLLEHFLEDQGDCDGIESVREACRERRARMEKNGNGI